uniref:Metalloendopeptidase n=2 Tax=Clastoptera arizonana TaxID=38151 RepID=A0A1B6ECD0_9HEMI
MIFSTHFLCFAILSSVHCYPIVENLTEIIKIKGDAGKPIKGRHPPIGPGTDKGLYNEGFFEGDIYKPKVPGNGESRNAVSEKRLLWPYGAVIYKTSDDVGCPDSPQCEILMKAMSHYHQKSCVRFKEWSGEDNFVEVFYNQDSSACWSPVGRIGSGVQRLSLGQRCWYFGIVVHELGHSMGFWHEMNRPDRDDWIYVYWQNIIKGFSSAFATHDSKSVDTLGEKFDYKSIMMYDEYAFSKDGVSPTLQSKTGVEIGPIWKKKGLSASDIRRIHKLYHCTGNKQKEGFPYNVACNFNSHTCGFKNGGSAVWNWRNVNSTDGYVYSSYETVGTTTGYFLSVNFHAVSPQDKTRGPLGCVRFWYLLQGDGNSSLKLLHAYLNKSTQLFHDPDTTFELWSNNTVGNKWNYVEVPLYVTRPFKLIFESQFEDKATYGTIALDDVEILYEECPEPVTTLKTTTTTMLSETTIDPGEEVTDENETGEQATDENEMGEEATETSTDDGKVRGNLDHVLHKEGRHRLPNIRNTQSTFKTITIHVNE